MSVRHVTVLAALLALIAATASSASATALRTDPFGATVPAGGNVMSGVGDTVFITGIGIGGCGQSSLSMTVGASGGTLITATLTNMTFIGCGCQKAPTVTVPMTIATTDVVLHKLYLQCVLNAGADVCYYLTVAATGTVENRVLGAALRFVSPVNFTHSVPPGVTDDAGAVCGTTGSWSTRGFTELTTGTPGTKVTVAAV